MAHGRPAAAKLRHAGLRVVAQRGAGTARHFAGEIAVVAAVGCGNAAVGVGGVAGRHRERVRGAAG